VFTERFSGSVVCLRTQHQKVNDPELLYNMRTFPNLVRARPCISHAYVCSILHTAINYLHSARAGRDLRPLSFACRVHYTTYSPLLPLARTPSLKAPDQQSHLLVETRTRRGRGRDSGNYPTAKITVALQRSDRVPRPLSYLRR